MGYNVENIGSEIVRSFDQRAKELNILNWGKVK